MTLGTRPGTVTCQKATLPDWRLPIQILILPDYPNPEPCDTTWECFSLPDKNEANQQKENMSNILWLFSDLGIDANTFTNSKLPECWGAW